MSTELSVIDSKIIDRHKFLCNKKEEIEKAFHDFKTHCRFRYNPTNNYSEVDLQSASLKDLIDINAFIIQKSQAYTHSAAVLELREYPAFEWLGFSAESWIHDIEECISRKNNKDVLKKLSRAIGELEDNMPEYLRKQKALEATQFDLPF